MIKKIAMALLLCAIPVHAADITAINGMWTPVGKSDINLFEGNIYITPIQKQTTGTYTLIYDQQKQGLTCFYVPEGAYYVCMPVILNKLNVQPSDRVDSVVEGALMEEAMFAKIEVDKKDLTIRIAPFGSDCRNPDTCEFRALPLYQRK